VRFEAGGYTGKPGMAHPLRALGYAHAREDVSSEQTDENQNVWYDYHNHKSEYQPDT
jgi:hypothetical protein